MAQLVLRNLSKTYGKETAAVRSVNLKIADKEFLTVLGPSGCGKSTILRMVAGLEKASAGEIFIDERLVNDVPPAERDIAMVFQNYALYPHMTVYDNISISLRLRGFASAEIKRRVSETAELLEIGELLKRRPKELSGGQRQRVALGRAIVRNPKVFLLDEPLSNLDSILRERMRAELKALFAKLEATVIYVTHDQTEAMTLSSRIVLMNEGQIQQIGTPHEVYHQPASVFVATFLGSPRINIVKCRAATDGLTLGRQKIKLEQLPSSLPENTNVLFGIRPEDIKVGEGELTGVLELIEPLGAFTLLQFDVDGCTLQALVDPDSFDNRREARLRLDTDHLHLFDLDTGSRL